MEAQILNRGLKLIENFYDGSMYENEYWDNDFYRIKENEKYYLFYVISFKD